MKIFIAIDIYNNCVSRLVQGDFSKFKKYNLEISKLLYDLKTSNISHIHVIDLDGAKSRKCINKKIIAQIRKEYNIMVLFKSEVELEQKRTLNFI